MKRLDKLKKLNFKKERILIIDDTPQKCRHNYGNAIYPKEYLGRNPDNELLLLMQYLLTLKNLDTVRNTEKRRWREEVEKMIR